MSIGRCAMARGEPLGALGRLCDVERVNGEPDWWYRRRIMKQVSGDECVRVAI